MDQFTQNVPLSPSKRPILQETEIEILLQTHVTIYEGEKKTKYERGNVTLTTHRIIWLDPEGKLPALALNLSLIGQIEEESGGMTGSPKIILTLTNKSIIRLGFKESGRDQYLAKLKEVLKRKAWGQVTEVKKKEEFTTTKAGIGGIMKTVESKTKETDVALAQAFSDLNTLMEKAREMVALSERLTLQLQKESGDVGDEFKSMLVSMGISSPVTKESAGSAYHTELSRQLADWLPKPLEVYGGMIALTDLYCLFNRARGTSLISPEDLQNACMLFERLNLPYRLRRFNSGVLVVQSANFSDDTVAKQIADLIKRDGPQTAFDIARTKHISLALANDQLTAAENLGVICRDQTVEGITYYLNFFADPALVKLYVKFFSWDSHCLFLEDFGSIGGRNTGLIR
jgi:ESCRT-II complex subunit VPS36